VKLTVIHDGFEPGSTIAEMVSVGWPDVISSLKTLLENRQTPSGLALRSHQPRDSACVFYGLGSTTVVTTQRCLPIFRSRANPSFS
jgi:hypothetical protein